MASALTLFTAYTESASRTASIRLVAHRFSWPAFWLGPLCLGVWRLWVPALLAFGFDLALVFGLRTGAFGFGTTVALWTLASTFAGLEAAEWRRRALMRRNSLFAGFAFGVDETDALARASGYAVPSNAAEATL